MSTVVVNRTLAVLNLPPNVLDLLNVAKAIQKAMTGNANFSSSAAKVTQLLADINALDASQTALGTKPPTTTAAARNILLEVVKNDLRLLRNDVQAAADAKPASAEAIILSASMSIKKTSFRNKQQNEAEDGNLVGEVILYAEGEGSHQWQQSPDGGETIIHLDPTSRSTTTVYNLQPGVKVWFRNRQILSNNNYGVWTNWLGFAPKVR